MSLKNPALALLFFVLQWVRTLGGEPGLVLAYQPLDGQGSGEVEIHPVTCHDMFGHSGYPNEISLIVAKNVPPNNSNIPLEDHNVAARAGIKISLNENAKGRFLIVLDLSETDIPAGFICSEGEIVGATLECIRKTAGTRLPKMILEAKFKPDGQKEARQVVERFKKQRKDKPFTWRTPAPGEA